MLDPLAARFGRPLANPDEHRPERPILLAVDQESRHLRIGGTIGSTQSGEAIEMVPSVDIHRVAFITGSAEDQLDTGWLLANFLNQDGVRGNTPSLRQHPWASLVASSTGMGARLG